MKNTMDIEMFLQIYDIEMFLQIYRKGQNNYYKCQFKKLR